LEFAILKLAQEAWPHAEPVFFGLEMCFGVIFTAVPRRIKKHLLVDDFLIFFGD
jgi:hypothetical protein